MCLAYERMSGRQAMRGALVLWQRRAAWDRRHAAVNAYRQVERDLLKSRRLAGELESEVGELRRDLAIRADEHAWRASFEAENRALRSALDESQKANLSLEKRYAELEEKYQMLWRATHDPNYVKEVPPPTNPEARGERKASPIWKRVPASKHAVERVLTASERRAAGSSSFGLSSERPNAAHPGWPSAATWSRAVAATCYTPGRSGRLSPKHERGGRGISPPPEDSPTTGITRLSSPRAAWPPSSSSSSAAAASFAEGHRTVTDISTFASRQHSAAAISNAAGAARLSASASASASGRPASHHATHGRRTGPGRDGGGAHLSSSAAAAADETPLRSRSEWAPPPQEGLASSAGGGGGGGGGRGESGGFQSGSSWLRSALDRDEGDGES
jgi:hypothetical protein